MSRAASLLDLRTRARQLSDTENDPNVTDAELNSLANRHATYVFDLLVAAGPPDYYAATATFTTTPAVAQYTLPANFRSLVDVYVEETPNGTVRPLLPMRSGELARWKPPTGTYSIRLEYIPVAPPMALDSDTFDGVSGWEELIANLMARDVMIKREADMSAVANNVAMLEARIVSASRSRDRGHPKYVTDLDMVETAAWPWGWAGSVRVASYRLRANALELYEPQWGMP